MGVVELLVEPADEVVDLVDGLFLARLVVGVQHGAAERGRDAHEEEQDGEAERRSWEQPAAGPGCTVGLDVLEAASEASSVPIGQTVANGTICGCSRCWSCCSSPSCG